MYKKLVDDLRIYMNDGDDEIRRKAADAIEELLAERDEINADSWKRAYEVERDEHRWIPVTERLPELNTVVQITDGIDVGHGYLASITSTQNMVYPSWHSPFCDIDERHITHWMPLPEPPKEKES